jgi:hypothetical protein
MRNLSFQKKRFLIFVPQIQNDNNVEFAIV